MFAAKHSLLNSLKGLSLHAEYYLPDGDLHFQVEQTIFRVHSYFFTRESPQFRERMAGAECARSSAHDGRTDQTAIPVKNTSVEDFSQLLWIFYNSTYIYNASPSIWGSILSLSSPGRWDFPKIHALALHNLNNLFLPTVDRIVLYTSCSVSFEHLLLLYVELCTRETSLSLEESIRLGSNLVVPIWQIRESLLRGEGKIEAADATQDNGTAAAGIPEKWIRDQIRYRLNAVQDTSSMMDTHMHYCLLHHEFDLHRVQTRVEKRERHTNGPQPKEKSTVSNTGSSNQETCHEDGWQEEGCCQCKRPSPELEYVLVEKSFLDNFLRLPGAWV
ncbi:hypothetical protein Ac2012v2_005266 [Leucoagaricus gongylophorus]